MDLNRVRRPSNLNRFQDIVARDKDALIDSIQDDFRALVDLLSRSAKLCADADDRVRIASMEEAAKHGLALAARLSQMAAE